MSQERLKFLYVIVLILMLVILGSCSSTKDIRIEYENLLKMKIQNCTNIYKYKLGEYERLCSASVDEYSKKQIENMRELEDNFSDVLNDIIEQKCT